ncbi:insulin receptor substrate 1 isoform X1 [Polistes fuscatus]|uniref:insulin receptor substrate 1 isoform X1 n=2 Tax=Polistes fuscatus TaxID=30207 RepID=UPI001CA913EE|nr:insulin receptor substrate 1 isoform X1 [Polistes fuscatus]XP_043491999.1 insulin receptor substrate 1 isoform X1 [Polistes fuscatus]XP_043492000.1 insulin receptor substrate 1 isoform X1 [Polistes fuscatus]XP_043492001.1 insulin receptor substrate 1 isoform X1 [Polistes fuscatus]XP_043492002.1 insulin receptor substrate 1 isoform X1 [Polistes fuscatus]XP_043492003.1 insulin receptor substrate 1 isoform X1 [Polistes fuscatus]XP_043492004.1 insulin receptor substrate 1 isoform X1 [Polistes 
MYVCMYMCERENDIYARQENPSATFWFLARTAFPIVAEAMSSGNRGLASPSCGPIVLYGHLKKFKTLKKKYFVLRGEAPGYPACLEYYDSKKKFESRQSPKRSILLHSCFNINKRDDTKYKHVIALYTKDECFCLILDNENELKDWLKAMLLLQSGDVPEGEQPRPTFEHVWQVTMQKKGLGERKNINGPYRLCLTDRTLSLVKIGARDNSDSIEFSLICIRRCGYMERIFYMEVGRSAVTGGGEFWMEAEDSNIAHNMHAAILNAMSNSNSYKDEVGPRQRMRSSSANEASKPISVLQRRHTGQKFHSFSPLEEQRTCKEQVDPLQEQTTTASAPTQCSQSQSTSSNTFTVVAGTGAGTAGIASINVNCATATRRRHSVASHPHSVNNSQSAHVTTSTTTTTTTITITTTATATTTTTTAIISHQRTLSLPLAAVIINQTQSSKRSVLRCTTGRDRCDSLPSRARTTSECHPTTVVLSHPRSSHFISHVPRPHSMYGRGLSYSPPVSSMPISPASGACSTDSAGSSLSMEDGGENILEESTGSRYGHSLTPDEPVILEENGDDYAAWSTTHSHHKYSPNFKSHSPSQQSSYVEMYSPCGSSPGRGGNYMPMSPATTAYSHSHASSLVEETNVLPDGYVPMAPVGDDGYVDMDPSNSHNGHFPDDMSQHGGSSCSVTSGTPSTDLRFSEYHLDKVTSFFAPGEDLQARPTRAYSVGSRPEPTNKHRKNRLDITQQEASRVRAFSVGSRSKRPELGRLANVVTTPLPSSSDNSNSNKSNSAPLLSSSWGHNSGCSGTSERMEDLMELDFTRQSVPATLSSPPSSYTQSQSQSYSTATTDTSSYVDMSPGQPPTSTTASYVDMSGLNKINRNNNNNSITANQNHSHVHVSSSASTHKPVITTLKPVEETESSYMKMDGNMEDWSLSGASPKQIPSPMQEDCIQTNGPPGGARTAPVDLPQPRRPPEGYVEMSFKARPSLEQDYINISMGMVGRNNRRVRVNNSRKENSRSQPIAIQAGSKPLKAPNFLPLNGSPTSESLASTPASPPRATPTGSAATIFPFSLNSPQSPIKPFTHQQKSDDSSSRIDTDLKNNDYDITTDNTTKKMNTINPVSMTDTTNNSISKIINDEPLSRSTDQTRVISNSISSQECTLNSLTKKFADLTVSKPRLVTASPNTSPTLSGFKTAMLQQKSSSPKFIDETPIQTPTSTPTPTPSPLDSDGYEKLQPGATVLHYASLDLPELATVVPVSPASVQEGFSYAEIDFTKLKQN